MTISLFAPLSIPSPDASWQSFTIPVGEWLSGIGVPETYALTIHAYALCILAGIVAAIWLTSARLTKRGAEPGIVLDIALWAVPFGIVGGRIFHVITHPDDYFGEGKNLLKTLYVWEGGLAIFGALTLGAVGVYIGCRFARIRFVSFADALVPGLLLAQAFGRLGNYFNQELFGQPTNLPWGLEIDTPNAAIPLGLPEGTLFAPTFLYEIVWNLVGVVVLLLIERRLNLRWGKMLGLYLIWYGIGRSWFESIRLDPSETFFGIRTNVWAALAAVVLGIIVLAVQSRRHPGAEPGPYVVGHEWSPNASAVDSTETYSDSDSSGNDAVSESETSAKSGQATIPK
ncbi:MAG: lgt [Glaciihabitans sp.]|nr:lgt [Glaciihabitans sp.]